MKNQHVALLRGINVGRAKRVAMADLRTLFEELGATQVRTLLNSGNVVFTASKPPSAARVEKALVAKLGVSSRITILSGKELAQAVARDPFKGKVPDPSRYLVAFLSRPEDQSLLKPLAKENWGNDTLTLGPRVAYLWCPGGILANKVWVAVERALKDGVTSRNWATVTKLHALVQDG